MVRDDHPIQEEFLPDRTKLPSQSDIPRRIIPPLSLRRKSEVGSSSICGGVNATTNLARVSGGSALPGNVAEFGCQFLAIIIAYGLAESPLQGVFV
jgi:hypothetical protein